MKQVGVQSVNICLLWKSAWTFCSKYRCWSRYYIYEITLLLFVLYFCSNRYNYGVVLSIHGHCIFWTLIYNVKTRHISLLEGHFLKIFLPVCYCESFIQQSRTVLYITLLISLLKDIFRFKILYTFNNDCFRQALLNSDNRSICPVKL